MNTLPWFVKNGGLIKSFQETYPDETELNDAILAIPEVHMFVMDDFNLVYNYEGDYESFLNFAKKCHFWDCNFPWSVFDFIIRSTQLPRSFYFALCNEVDKLDRNARALKYFTNYNREPEAPIGFKINAIEDPDLLNYVAYELQIDSFPKVQACSYAARYGNLDYIKLFREWNCPWGNTCSQAIEYKKYDILEYAIRNGAEMTNDDIIFMEKNTSIFENLDGSQQSSIIETLVSFDNLETFRILITSFKDKCILSLLSIAAKYKANRCLSFIVEINDSSELIDVCCNVVTTNDEVGIQNIIEKHPRCIIDELVFLAIKSGSIEVLRLMIDFKPLVFKQNKEFCEYAIKQKNMKC